MKRHLRFTLPFGELALVLGTLGWFGTDAPWWWCITVAALAMVGVGVVLLSCAWAMGDYE